VPAQAQVLVPVLVPALVPALVWAALVLVQV
jgi:hypothetical protein